MNMATLKVSGIVSSNALHVSIEKSDIKIVKALIHAGADVNGLCSGSTPLHKAVDIGNVDIVKALIHAGADVNALCSGSTPLHRAVVKGNVEILKALLTAGADVNALNIRRTPLHLAAQKGDVEIIKALLTAGASVNAIDSTFLDTPLHLAAQKGNVEIIKTFLTAGAIVNATNSLGETPLHSAAKKGNVKIIKALIIAGGNIHAENGGDETPLNLAAEKDWDMARLLATGTFPIKDSSCSQIMIKYHLLRCLPLYKDDLEISLIDFGKLTQCFRACKKQVIAMSQDLVDDKVSLLDYLNAIIIKYQLQSNISTPNHISDIIFRRVLAMEYPLYTEVLCENLGRSYFAEKFDKFTFYVKVQSPVSEREITLDVYSMKAIAKYLTLFDLSNFVFAFYVQPHF